MADRTLSPVTGAPPIVHTPASSTIDLRPFTTSELIDRGFSLYRSHFAGFFLLALLCQAAPLLNQILVTALNLNPSQTDVLQEPQQAFLKLGIIAFLGALSHIVVFCFEIIITFYIADAYLGKIPSVTDSMRKFTGNIPWAIWTSLLSMALIAITFIFPLGALGAPYFYALVYPPTGWISGILLIAAAFVLFIISLVPLLAVFMRLMLIVPALALEGMNGWKAVWRSSSLVRYDPGLGILYWGEMRLSFLLLPLFIIELLILSLTSLPLVIYQITEAIRHGGGQMTPPPDSTVIISQIMTFLAISLILPLYPIATTLFYYDIRIRREGFDLEVMARQLGEEP